MTTLATGSCFSCRRSKRRCDKRMPACQLCLRKGSKCAYPQRRGQRFASPIENTPGIEWTIGAESIPVPASIPLRPSSQSPLIPSSFARATAIAFLAPSLFREASLDIPRLDLDIPPEIAAHLGDRQQMRETTAEFFQLTRSWMSIVSPRRHLAAVLNPLSATRRPSALLALCMKLCCLPVSRRDDGDGDGDGDTERTSLYRLVKRFYAEVESTEGLCLQVLQAAVLIAVFEIGDAIYPAAYLTVGACARYGIAMGLDKVNKDRMGGGTRGTDAASWMDIEERRRVWWGVLILDRFLNIADPTRSLATEDPAFEDFLPVDDEKFYDATAVPEDANIISQAFTYKIGQFRRLAQATYLISQVLVTIRSSPIAPNTHSHSHANTSISRPMDTAQLCRTLDVLVRANEVEATIGKLAFCCQSLVSFSGILLLQEHHWSQVAVQSTEDAERHTFSETRNAFDTLYRIALFLKQGSETQLPLLLLRGQCTFFLASVVYHASSALMTIGRGDPSAVVREKIEAFGWLLGFLGERWPLSGVYLSILEAKEALLAVEAM
ncbi:hypothetical protein ASPCAL04265 [Aspergillus calidoustus]|uniref:Zn(2)-C6 fungal-type domain-containing protein n=1 Tax=Aspergillus calidoustus TaxID=454130 RepID=A0A0U5GQR2_ASPCI|nr:hypothetical protein ASPCAL04265 [Aspergillus calidoustus]